MRLGQTSRLIHYPELREERGLGPPRGEKLFTGKAEEEMFVNKGCPVMWISFLGKNVTSVNSSLPGIGPFQCKFILQLQISSINGNMYIYFRHLKER